MTSFFSRFSFGKVKDYALGHKIISVIVILVLLFGIYEIYGHFTNTSSEPRYVISAVSNGTIVSAVTGSGQVSASSQVDVLPKASGEITEVDVVSGQTVSVG